MLNPTQRQFVQEHFARYEKEVRKLEEKFGSAQYVPVEDDDAISAKIYSEFPGTYEAVSALIKIENRLWEGGHS